MICPALFLKGLLQLFMKRQEPLHLFPALPSLAQVHKEMKGILTLLVSKQHGFLAFAACSGSTPHAMHSPVERIGCLACNTADMAASYVGAHRGSFIHDRKQKTVPDTINSLIGTLNAPNGSP